MKTYASDVDRAAEIHQEYDAHFPYISPEQIDQIKVKSEPYRRWFLAHPRIHNSINALLILAIFFADFYLLTHVPELLPAERSIWADILWALPIGLLHGWIMCGMVTFSVHEGASHNLIFQGSGRVIRGLQKLSANMCRLSLVDPEYYAQGHKAHHQYFGSDKDGSFSNFVRVKRLALSLVPASALMSYSDFFPWRPLEKTKSKSRSMLLGKVYMIGFAIYMVPNFGGIFTLVTLLTMGAWSSCILDRLREAAEHLFMPLDKTNGTRQLGIGFWGLFLGGGFWGQPCHLSHHLAPGLPWYFQVRLHLDLKRIFTEEQKTVFFLKPFTGYPKLVMHFLKHGHTDEVTENRPVVTPRVMESAA